MVQAEDGSTDTGGGSLIAPATLPACSDPDLISRLERSVVRITQEMGQGSGVLIARDVVLTALHVVEGRPSGFEVRSWDGAKVATGTVAQTDPGADLALVVLDAPLPGVVASLADAVPRKGAPVLVIGNPLGVSGYLTEGTVASFDGGKVWTNAQTNPGNSGGPMFDEAGRLIAIITNGGVPGMGYGSGVEAIRAILAAWQSPATIPDTVLVPLPTHRPIPQCVDSTPQAEAPMPMSPEEMEAIVADLVARVQVIEAALGAPAPEPEIVEAQTQPAPPFVPATDREDLAAMAMTALQAEGLSEGAASLLVESVIGRAASPKMAAFRGVAKEIATQAKAAFGTSPVAQPTSIQRVSAVSRPQAIPTAPTTIGTPPAPVATVQTVSERYASRLKERTQKWPSALAS